MIDIVNIDAATFQVSGKLGTFQIFSCVRSHLNGGKMQVIGTGLGRTGTVSLRKALEILGFKCYHGFEVYESDTLFWDNIMHGLVVF